jgi:hypothetical protein
MLFLVLTNILQISVFFVHLQLSFMWHAWETNILYTFTYKYLINSSNKFLPFAAPTVQLIFSSHFTKLKAEKFRAHILQAFESVLGSPVTIEIRCESNKETSAGFRVPLILPASKNGSSQMAIDPVLNAGSRMPRTGEYLEGRSEIVEVPTSPRKYEGNEPTNHNVESSRRGLQHTRAGESVSNKKPAVGSLVERRKLGETSQSKSIVRSKVSLARVIQQAEGCTQQAGWSKHKAVSIAEKLEQENLYVFEEFFILFTYYHANLIIILGWHRSWNHLLAVNFILLEKA